MLYPKEDKENRQLIYACRNCDHKQLAENPCIYVNKLLHEVELVLLIALRVFTRFFCSTYLSAPPTEKRIIGLEFRYKEFFAHAKMIAYTTQLS